MQIRYGIKAAQVSAFGGLLTLSLMTGVSPSTAQAQGTPSALGTATAQSSSGTVNAPTQVILQNLPDIESDAAGTAQEIPFRTPFTPEAYQAMKDAASSSVLAPGSTAAPQVAGVSADAGAILPDTPGASKLFLPPVTGELANSGGWIPSDMALAASSTKVVQVVNARIAVMDVNGVLLMAKGLPAFIGVAATHACGDPRALYDPHSARFIVTVEDFSINRLFVCASQTSDPTLGWWIYNFDMSGGASAGGDFPMLGQTLQEPGDAKGGIYCSWIRFFSAGGFDDEVIILPKSKVYAGLGFTFFAFAGFNVGGTPMDTLQPANVMNSADRPMVEYLINTFNFAFGACPGGCNGLVIWAVKNGVPPKNQAPSITGVVIGTVNNYFLPATGPQAPGCCSVALETGTPRFDSEVTYSAGNLYGAIPSARGVEMFVVHPYLNGAAAIIGASIPNEISFGTGGFVGGGDAYYPTMQPDPEGNFTLVYNYSDTGGTRPSTAYLTCRTSQAPGTVHDSGFFLQGGLSCYCLVGGGRNRWGDYTAACPAYTTPGAMWFSGEFSEASGLWGTAIGKNGYTSPTQP